MTGRRFDNWLNIDLDFTFTHEQEHWKEIGWTYNLATSEGINSWWFYVWSQRLCGWLLFVHLFALMLQLTLDLLRFRVFLIHVAFSTTKTLSMSAASFFNARSGANRQFVYFFLLGLLVYVWTLDTSISSQSTVRKEVFRTYSRMSKSN